MIFTLFYSCQFSDAQGKKRNISLIKDGNYYFNEDDFKNALNAYSKALINDSLNANVHYKIGLCYLNLQNSSENFKSIPYLEKALQNLTLNYNYNSNREKNAPLDTWIFLGDAYKQKFDFENAEKCYQQYLNNAKEKHNPNFEYVRREKSSINNAREILLYPKELKKDSLIVTLERTDEIQSCPVISKDGKIMIFCMGKNNVFPPDFHLGTPTTDYKMDKIYLSFKENGIWQKPANIMSSLHAKELTIPTSLSPDGKTLYLVRDNNDNGNIYESQYSNGRFGKMKKMGKNINSRFWESHASISDDGNSLYFTSDRPGGFGGLDIYVSEKNSKGEWSPAKNLGNIINTPYDEETPFIVDSGKTLYFSSQGHYNMGGFDVFCSVKNDSSWSQPLNIGFPLNTVGNDLVYLPKIDSAFAFAPLNRYGLHELSGSDNDLYYRQVPNKNNISTFSITGCISSDFKNFNNNNLYFVTIEDSSSSGHSIPVEVKLIGNNYKITVPSGLHKITYNLKGYQPVIHSFNFPPLYGYNHVSVDISFKPTEELVAQIQKSDSVIKPHDTLTTQPLAGKWKARNVLFAFDKHMAQGYQSGFDSIADYLIQHPNTIICLTGFADAVGDSEYNLQLSKRRALFVKEQLIALGVKENSIQVKWNGEDNPVATNSTKEGRALNRRVEITLASNT